MRSLFRPPRHVLAMFLAVAAVSAAALVWLMARLLEQEHTVERQRRQERLEQAADRATVAMQAAVGDLDRAVDLPPNVVQVRISAAGLEAEPEGRLLYFPRAPDGATIGASRFDDGELAEFGRKDPGAALEIYARLAADADKAVRAEAFARLARVKRRLNDFDGALADYERLAEFSGVRVCGLPAALLARQGRLSVFRETYREGELRNEAARLDQELREGRWRLTKSEFEFHREEVSRWLDGNQPAVDADAIARAEGVSWLWEHRSGGEPIRRLIKTADGPALVLSRLEADGLVAVVAGPAYLAKLCAEAMIDPGLRCTLSDPDGQVVFGDAPPSRLRAIRTPAAAKLPWTLQVFASPRFGAEQGSSQRTLLLWVALVLALVWFTGAAFIVRAIRREARVAQLQTDFVAAVSHEFRSPLAALCQMSEMLATDRLASPDLRRQAFIILVRETERLRRLVEGLLDFQRVDAGAEVYHLEPVEIGTFLESLVNGFQESVTASGYTIELRGLPEPMHLQADREALGRAVWNLLDNAVKYSPECRRVWVEVERRYGWLSVTVRDHGLGIPVAEQKDVFEKFVRGADSKARRIKGTGIGLAMVRHIVQAHGGEILLSSRPGEGSRFTMVLPAEAGSAQA